VLVPLSWLRDFAPFEGDPADLAASLDDLGLVVEAVEQIGEGLSDVVVVRVDEIAAIEGADRIRRVVVDDGTGPVEVVCGAWNFGVGDLVPLAKVGAVLPGGFAIGKRKMKGVVSHGMLCSGRELRISEDHEGILRLNDVEGAVPGVPLAEALGLEPDVVFDVAVEANRPDAWSMVGVARDLAARMGLPFTVPEPAGGAGVGPGARPDGTDVGDLATVRVDDLELCPRFTARVITGVEVGPSPEWLARRLVLAGMRPINNVVDASNYVMLELGQPTHPYDLDRLPGHGLLVRRARPGETVTTLDGVERTLGRPGPGLGDTGQDCLICDAEGDPVAIGGVMGGASSEIDEGTTRVLLEAAYFVPMAIARTSKRLALRTEASARFERGCDPAGIDRAAARFSELLALTAGPAMEVAPGVIDIVGDVPQPVLLTVRPARINALLGTSFTAAEVADLLQPLGITVSTGATSTGAVGATAPDGDEFLDITVPTFRPDIRPAPMGEADIAEEVARTYGYVRIARRRPAWPQPGRLSDRQRDRRLLKDVLCDLGASEAWTTTFLSRADLEAAGAAPPFVEITNPLVEVERFLRTSMVAGLVGSVRYNLGRRQSGVRLFEVGSVFRHDGPAVAADGSGDGGSVGGSASTQERLSVILAADGDDAWSAVAAWRTVAEALGLDSWSMEDLSGAGLESVAAHPYRSAALVGSGADRGPGHGDPVVVGVVGELDPTVVARFELVGADGRPRRVGWLDLDLGVLLDRERVARQPEHSRPLSRFPSSDIDLAFVVRDDVPASAVERTLRASAGELLESVELFDVYRGPSLADASRSLAFHLRFCALDRTLTDEEIGGLRAACIAAVEGRYDASLR
jgi:phenylalanyl-tRNA synthetase beta chain